jgi:hypothetical protein
MLALRDEGRGGIVDENIERRLAPDLVHHVLDSTAVADVAADRRNLAAGLFAHPGGSRLQTIELAAADHKLGAQFEKATPHRGAQARAAAGDQHPLVPQQACFKHRLNPLSSNSVIVSAVKQ